MEQPGEKQELTLKQRRFVHGYLEGKPIVQAAAEAGYSASTGARGAAELLRSPKVRTAIQEALENAGVTDECIATIIREGLAALKVTHLIHKGKIKPLGAADWAARHRFLDTVLRLKAAFPADKLEVTGESFEDRIRRLRGLIVAGRTIPQAELPESESLD